MPDSTSATIAEAVQQVLGLRQQQHILLQQSTFLLRQLQAVCRHTQTQTEYTTGPYRERIVTCMCCGYEL